jgi:hypothetical protein
MVEMSYEALAAIVLGCILFGMILNKPWRER